MPVAFPFHAYVMIQYRLAALPYDALRLESVAFVVAFAALPSSVVAVPVAASSVVAGIASFELDASSPVVVGVGHDGTFLA